jgi:hypothetical protein
MTPSAIVTAHRMVGSVIPDMVLVSLITIQMSKAGFVPLTSIVTYPAKAKPDLMPDLVDQIRQACKVKMQKSVLLTSFLMENLLPILNWKWRKYTGANKHTQHCHFSFKKEADNDGAFFQIPMLGASNG